VGSTKPEKPFFASDVIGTFVSRLKRRNVPTPSHKISNRMMIRVNPDTIRRIPWTMNVSEIDR